MPVLTFNMLALLSSCSKMQQQSSPDSLHIRCSHNCPESADVLINACKPAVTVPLFHCGLTADSGTSIQQGFASDVLVNIAVCMCQLVVHLNYMCASASCVVTCLYLHSEICFVIIILVGQA